MTHSLIDHNGQVKVIDPYKYDGLDKATVHKIEAIEEFDKFNQSDAPWVFDLIEPSNTTLMYLTLALATCVSSDKDGNMFIDPLEVKSKVLANIGSIEPYISMADQILAVVNPGSPSYESNKGLVASYNSQEFLNNRIQIIMQSILFRFLNPGDYLDIVVSDSFDIPYMLRTYANVKVWNKDQYDSYSKKMEELANSSKESDSVNETTAEVSNTGNDA